MCVYLYVYMVKLYLYVYIYIERERVLYIHYILYMIYYTIYTLEITSPAKSANYPQVHVAPLMPPRRRHAGKSPNYMGIAIDIYLFIYLL